MSALSAFPHVDEMCHERFDSRAAVRVVNMTGNTAQPDDPGVGPFHVDFAAHDAALMARTWKIAFWTLAVAAVFTALVIGPYIATNWTRITNAVACSEEVV